VIFRGVLSKMSEQRSIFAGMGLITVQLRWFLPPTVTSSIRKLPVRPSIAGRCTLPDDEANTVVAPVRLSAHLSHRRFPCSVAKNELNKNVPVDFVLTTLCCFAACAWKCVP
jgi:hypothetical protein